MAEDGFDFTEFSEFEKKIISLATQTMPKESRKFIREEGTKLRKLTLSKARAKVSKKTGNLFKGIKRGRVYTFRGNGGLSIRVFGGKLANHIHLLEYGHRVVDKNGKELGFVQGKHFFEEAANEFTEPFYHDSQKFIDNVIDEGLHL